MTIDAPVYYFSRSDIFHRPNLPVDVFRVVHNEPMPMHRHEFSEMVIVTRGEALHVTDSHEQLIMMGDVFVANPSCVHGYENAKGLELTNILFSEDLLVFSNGCSPDDISMKLETDQLVRINEMVRELEESAALLGPGSTCLITSSFMKIIGTLLQWHSEVQNRRTNPDYQVARAFTYIAERYAEKVSLSDLTDTAGMSESSLTRAFRRTAGLTPIEYVISYRIRQSCRLLQYTDKNVTEIAFACGFADSNYFSRKFHGLMELPPLEYRRQSRRKDPPFDIVLPQPSESPGQSAP
jgi:AraC-like DNA-binding protein